MAEEYTFIYHEGANPECVKDQKELIAGLRVGKVEEVLPESLLAIYQKAREKGLKGKKTFEVEKDKQVRVDAKENGIVEIRGLREQKGEVLKEATHRIEDYYLVDPVTGKAFDVSQLWESELRGDAETKVVVTGEVLSTLMPTNDGGVLIINKPTDHPLGKIASWIAKDKLLILDHLVPLHEMGHRPQVILDDPNVSPETRGKSYARRVLESSLIQTLLVVPFLPNLASSLIPKIGEDLAAAKQRMAERERNTHAFALGVIRKLKDEGVDVLRGIPNSEIAKTIDYWLMGGYDVALAGVKGEFFSRILRVRQRQLSGEPGWPGKLKKALMQTPYTVLVTGIRVPSRG